MSESKGPCLILRCFEKWLSIKWICEIINIPFRKHYLTGTNPHLHIDVFLFHDIKEIIWFCFNLHWGNEVRLGYEYSNHFRNDCFSNVGEIFLFFSVFCCFKFKAVSKVRDRKSLSFWQWTIKCNLIRSWWFGSFWMIFMICNVI